MKKKLLVLIGLFLLTGCTAEYNLTYENNVFDEEIIIYEDKGIEDDDSFVSITDINENDERVKLSDNKYYKVSLSNDNTHNILKLNYTYDDLSLKESKVFEECFEVKSFMDEKDYYYIHLSGDVTCEYLTSAKVTFRTDKKVLKTNATTKDEKDGTYTWDKLTSDGVEIQVSKNLDKGYTPRTKTMIPWYVSIPLFVVLGVVVFALVKYIKQNNNY